MTSNILDTDNMPVDVVLMFHSVQRSGWFWKLLKPGFQHVQVWMKFGEQWVQLDGCLEGMFVSLRDKAPWEFVEEGVTYIGLRRDAKLGHVREPFHIGPITCVDLAKAVLCIRKPLIRTPYQLYRYLRGDTD